MHYRLKLVQIGNSVGVTFPKELLAAMNVDKGATITATSGPDGFRLTPYDPDVDKQVGAGREFMKEYRDTLRALAK